MNCTKNLEDQFFKEFLPLNCIKNIVQFKKIGQILKLLIIIMVPNKTFPYNIDFATAIAHVQLNQFDHQHT